MKKTFWIIGGIAALLILFSATFASAKTTDAMVVKKQEQKAGKVAKKKVAAEKSALHAPFASVQKAPVGRRVMYVKVLATLPWYYNFWILLVAGGSLFLAGGIIGRLLKLGPIPRRSE